MDEATEVALAFVIFAWGFALNTYAIWEGSKSSSFLVMGLVGLFLLILSFFYFMYILAKTPCQNSDGE